MPLTAPALGLRAGGVVVPMVVERTIITEETEVGLIAWANATIVDGPVGTSPYDEPRPSISDFAKSEGKKGQTTLFTFTAILSAAYEQAVTMSFATANGTAKTNDGD